ncbi:MAG: efflux RND transporter periplasmic adaptor subunit [Hyphomicrobiaceae bacterium]|nr:efflux RND transporter periplasmic adaptor subunit [Hyphomicrobiaceae bacterium]
MIAFTAKYVRMLAIAGVVGIGGYLFVTGKLPWTKKPAQPATVALDGQKGVDLLAAAVTVSRVTPMSFVEQTIVTGTLVPRDEILVGPEIEGLRIVEVLVDEGARVKKGDILARLVTDTLDAQIAQSDASLAKAAAAVAQSKSNIIAMEAKNVETKKALERGRPLRQSGVISEATQDVRESAATSAQAQLVSAQDALKLTEADKRQVEALRRDLDWKRSRTDVRAPADGVVSRRVARVGGYAAGAADAMFRIIARGEIELEADVPEVVIARMKDGQRATVDVAGVGEVPGVVRLVSPEVDRATRLGKVRIFLGDTANLRIGAFARGAITVATSEGLGVPLSAVLYSDVATSVQLVRDNKIVSKSVKTGLQTGSSIEIREGLIVGDFVVTRSGTFLREGDAVRPMIKGEKVTEVRQ